MRRKSKVAVCFITALAVFTGCGANGDNTLSSSNNIEVVETKEKIQNSQKAEEKGNLQMLTDNVWQASYGTEQGWYYFNSEYEIIEEDKLPAIMYVDYQSGKDIYLCNKVNCKHNSYDCNAVLPEEIDREKVLFGQGKYLYIATSDYDEAGSMASEVIGFGEDSDGNVQVQEEKTYVPAIYRMKLDGTEREKVMDLESGTVLESKFLGDGENLYAIQKKIKKETKDTKTYSTGYDRALVKVDMKNKKTEKIMDLDNETEILGCAQRTIVTGTTDFGRKVTTEEKQNDDNLYKKADYVIKSVNIDSKKSVTLKTLKQENAHREMISGNNLYVSNEKENKIDVINFLTEEKTKIKTSMPLSIDDIIKRKDGTDVLGCISYDYNGEGQGWDYYLVDTKTKKTTKGKLKNSENTPVEIVAQSSDKMLVVNDSENVSEDVPWAGVTQEVVGEEEYSIISKEDYLNNKANYKKVNMIGMKK